MTYYNYHGICKKLIASNHLIGITLFDRYKHISPALVFYFDNHKPMPIREYKFKEYYDLLKSLNINIPINKKSTNN